MRTAQIIAFPTAESISSYEPHKRKGRPMVGIKAAAKAVRDAATATSQAERQERAARGEAFAAETVALRAIAAMAATPAASPAEFLVKLETLLTRIEPMLPKGPLPALVDSLRADAKALLG